MASLSVVQRFGCAATALCIVVAAGIASPDAHAQFKWTDSSGRVNYSDRPPAPEQRSALAAAGKPANAAAPVGDPALPWALRSAMTRYPVVLYTTAECDPCELARVHFAQRGVPFVEKRVETAADLLAFKALGFANSLFPSASIGPEKLTGYEEIGWNRTLDATGYPKSSMLPANYAARRVAPMRPDSARADGANAGSAAAPATSPQDDASPEAPARTDQNADGLLSTSSFRTGPNPIRF